MTSAGRINRRQELRLQMDFNLPLISRVIAEKPRVVIIDTKVWPNSRGGHHPECGIELMVVLAILNELTVLIKGLIVDTRRVRKAQPRKPRRDLKVPGNKLLCQRRRNW